MPGATILVVDDEKAIRDSLRTVLAYERYRVLEAGKAEEAYASLEKDEVGAVLLDVKMPGVDGLAALEEIRKRSPDTPVIMISGHGTVATAVEASKKGAFDFLEKPPDTDRLLLTLRNALKESGLRRENRLLRTSLTGELKLLGASEALQKVLATVERVARTDATVLITGENGSGKELVARAIHLQSERAGRPFVDVNCAAIPGELIESELFGHEAGAFTGATARRRGKFEQADGGTLFLDEVGDMSLPAQAKILRVLETREVSRVGGSEKTTVDVRVVSATNKDLPAEVRGGKFREDLLYRLNVVPIQIPSLRDRRGDIGTLAAHFLHSAVERNGLAARRFSNDALKRLSSAEWPGNVRQLKNACERLAITAEGDEIALEEVEAAIRPPPAAASSAPDPLDACATFEEWKDAAERRFLERRLAANQWNIKKTAEDLKMQRSNLYKKIEKYGLK
ncbi:MAG: sigma-54 dependent transcriptional regulator [Planctomycetales bacterium]|nr:sigma-54 dependent transcriptional regulator [Planctomycetales bacterium]